MDNKKVQHVVTFTLLIGIIVFQLGNHTVEASSIHESIFSINIFEWSPIIWAVVIIAGSIGITLSYVSWKKYKGEKKHSKNERQNN
ncbi:sporulation protein YpjB [Oceanobacillus sp. Castelsardo]|uniref:sporulation protein YpjB n=1 Tax=Oceanobacillus sp. Castelsardo TaxID=1851204 RepID=UPI000838236C|nr:sporulation protein YpjB [Oceanobacillus sp. Castelsardo]